MKDWRGREIYCDDFERALEICGCPRISPDPSPAVLPQMSAAEYAAWRAQHEASLQQQMDDSLAVIRRELAGRQAEAVHAARAAARAAWVAKRAADAAWRDARATADAAWAAADAAWAEVLRTRRAARCTIARSKELTTARVRDTVVDTLDEKEKT